MRIAESARKHGIPDEDILHAIRNVTRTIDQDDVTLLIGPGRDGALLEIGLLDVEDDALVIHAMRLRPHLLG